MNFQGVVMNVADLTDRSTSIERCSIYAAVPRGAVGGGECSRKRPSSGHRVAGAWEQSCRGARHIGLRAFVLEVEPADLERIASDLASRRLLVSRRDHREWTAVVGRDPDGVGVVVACVPGARAITEESWRTLDDVLYGIGE